MAKATSVIDFATLSKNHLSCLLVADVNKNVVATLRTTIFFQRKKELPWVGFEPIWIHASALPSELPGQLIRQGSNLQLQHKARQRQASKTLCYGTETCHSVCRSRPTPNYLSRLTSPLHKTEGTIMKYSNSNWNNWTVRKKTNWNSPEPSMDSLAWGSGETSSSCVQVSRFCQT